MDTSQTLGLEIPLVAHKLVNSKDDLEMEGKYLQWEIPLACEDGSLHARGLETLQDPSEAPHLHHVLVLAIEYFHLLGPVA